MKDKIVLVCGGHPSPSVVKLLTDKHDIEIVTPEIAKAKYNISEITKPEPIQITPMDFESYQIYKAPLTRAERRKQQRKSK